jgi:hypothetical protein
MPVLQLPGITGIESPASEFPCATGIGSLAAPGCITGIEQTSRRLGMTAATWVLSWIRESGTTGGSNG